MFPRSHRESSVAALETVVSSKVGSFSFLWSLRPALGLEKGVASVSSETRDGERLRGDSHFAAKA